MGMEVPEEGAAPSSGISTPFMHRALDSGVTPIDDLLYYLQRFEAGC